jgi:hypothetical protein
MGHTRVPEPASRWAGAVRNRRLAPPGPAAAPVTTPATPATPGTTPATSTADLAASTVAALFRAHHGELVRLAVLMVGDLPTAEDVVQDVYASLHSRWSELAAPDSIVPYVRACMLIIAW